MPWMETDLRPTAFQANAYTTELRLRSTSLIVWVLKDMVSLYLRYDTVSFMFDLGVIDRCVFVAVASSVLN